MKNSIKRVKLYIV